MIFMARSTKSYEERLLQLEKREQESLEKAKQYAAQKRELKKRQKDVETKNEPTGSVQIGGAVESVIGSAIEEEDIPKLVGFLKRQEANGKFFSKAMQKSQLRIRRKCNAGGSGVSIPFIAFYEGRTYGQPEVVRISLPQVATGLR